MPKHSKTKTPTSGATTPVAEEDTAAAAEPGARPMTKKRPSRARTSSAKKTSAGSLTKKRAAKPRQKTEPAVEPSDADIRLRAYFIAERRVQLALQGDPAKDWLEAKRQLLEEARPTR